MSEPGPAASATATTAASRGPSRFEPCRSSLPATCEPLPEPPAGFLPFVPTTYAATPPPTASTARIATISAARLFCGVADTGYCAEYTPELGVTTIADGPDGLVAMIVGPVAPIITGPVIGAGVGIGVRCTMC